MPLNICQPKCRRDGYGGVGSGLVHDCDLSADLSPYTIIGAFFPPSRGFVPPLTFFFPPQKK
uniref:Uncharacterized protein n=1 Tax=Arabidopsis thaliana TaxID=3702 RepID=Q8L767_ARATH|nr:unknown protein [Arabidopsis thaliana]AAN15553.1 unknown protein [Arabidopsis thaliana]